MEIILHKVPNNLPMKQKMQAFTPDGGTDEVVLRNPDTVAEANELNGTDVCVTQFSRILNPMQSSAQPDAVESLTRYSRILNPTQPYP